MLTNPNNITIPGDFVLHDIFLSSPLNTELSLVEVFDQINIYESLFKDTLSGNIAITDTNNLLVEYPIVGHESITLIFDNPLLTDSTPIEKKFRVYGITQYTAVGEDVAGYMINFVSEEFITSSSIKISKSYIGRNISDMVESIYDDYLDTDKVLVVEKTRNLHDVIIPNWSPLHSMNWLASRGMSEDHDGANYFFFETLDGFNFVSMEKLIDDVRKDKIAYPNGTKTKYSYGMKNVGESNTGIAHTIADSYNVDSTSNIIQNLSRGMYGSKLITHDIVKREYKKYNFDYKETYDEYIHVEENNTTNSTSDNQQSTMLVGETIDDFDEKYDSHQLLIPIHYQMYGGVPVSNRDTSHHEKSIQIRTSQLQQLDSYKLVLNVPGDPNRRTGDLVYFECPTVGATMGEITEDKLYSGNYVVLAVRNIFGDGVHETVLELVKDSYFTPLRKELS